MILVAKLSAVHAGGEFGCEIRSLGTDLGLQRKTEIRSLFSGW